MDEDQLQNIAKYLVNNAIENAIDIIKTESKKTDEGLDQGVDDIVGLTIGQSVNAVQEGQRSPTDNKMKEWVGQMDQEVDDIIGLTIGRSVTAICKGQSSPTDIKMKEWGEECDKEVGDIVGLTIGRAVAVVREGQCSQTDNHAEGMLGLNKTEFCASPEVTNGATGSKVREIYNDERIPLNVGGNDNQPHVFTPDLAKDDWQPAGTMRGHMNTAPAQIKKSNYKKNALERWLDRILKRDKKKVKEAGAAMSTAGGANIPVDGKKKRASKAHNKSDWIRKNLLCCFVRHTATVEPLCA